MTTTAEVRDTKERYQIRANYVLGCDGAKSRVRKWLGIESEGEDSCKRPSESFLHFLSYLLEEREEALCRYPRMLRYKSDIYAP